MKGQPRPHRKKTLPVPGDVFISLTGWMRVITPTGYDLVGMKCGIELYENNGLRFGALVNPDHLIANYYNDGFYYLGNALTDEWEDG